MNNSENRSVGLIWGNGDEKAPVEKPTSESTIMVERPVYSETINNRIYFYSDVSTTSILKLNREIRCLNNELIHRKITEEIPEIQIFLHLNSFGGGVFAGLSGMDEILNCKIPVYTIVDGCCASAATFLSVVGKKRFINRHAYMLIHQITSFFWGKYEEFKDEKENLDKMMDMIKKVYKEYTKFPIKKLEEILKRDLWLNSDECLEYGLVDEII